MPATSTRTPDLTPAQREARVRVTAALVHSGLRPDEIGEVTAPPGHTPADDLTLAVHVAQRAGAVPAGALDRIAFRGELSLDGHIRAGRGLLRWILDVPPGVTPVVPWQQGREAITAREAWGSPARRPMVAATVLEVLAWLRGDGILHAAEGAPWAPERPDMGDTPEGLPPVPEGARVLLVGSPGSGRTLAARSRWAGAPEPTRAEALAASLHHSDSGLIDPGRGLLRWRPFRAPHHTVSEAGMVGARGRPGEVQLAAHGVLLLDEMPEFRLAVLRAIRTELDAATRRGDAPWQVVATAHPCPCGWHGSTARRCGCPPSAVQRYQATTAERAALLGIIRGAA